MRSAPAVSYPVGRSRFHMVLICMIAVIGTVVNVAWLVQPTPAPNLLLVSSTAVLQVALIWNAVHRWRLNQAAQLAWSGRNWRFSDFDRLAQGTAEAPTSVRIVLDLQFTLLVFLTDAQGNGRWVWAEQRKSPPLWLPFRRALVASDHKRTVSSSFAGEADSKSNGTLNRQGNVASKAMP